MPGFGDGHAHPMKAGLATLFAPIARETSVTGIAQAVGRSAGFIRMSCGSGVRGMTRHWPLGAPSTGPGWMRWWRIDRWC